MIEIWKKFENWLSENWTEGFSDLNSPANDKDILKLESDLNVKLPNDFIECLKIHNGQGNMAGGLIDNSEFLSTDAILDNWKVWYDLHNSGDFKGIYSEPDKGVKNDWWNPKWIPFSNNNSNHYCLDLDPTSKGNYGQIISMYHDASNREIVSINFKSWFNSYVNDVCGGQYKYSEDFGGLTHIDYA